jgi:hypothetical protein
VEEAEAIAVPVREADAVPVREADAVPVREADAVPDREADAAAAAHWNLANRNTYIFISMVNA